MCYFWTMLEKIAYHKQNLITNGGNIAGSLKIDEGNFKEIRGRYDGFFHGARPSLRHWTSICQKLCTDFEQKLFTFPALSDWNEWEWGEGWNFMFR